MGFMMPAAPARGVLRCDELLRADIMRYTLMVVAMSSCQWLRALPLRRGLVCSGKHPNAQDVAATKDVLGAPPSRER